METRGHRGWGGGTGGTRSWDPVPRHGLVGPYARKQLFRTQEIRTQLYQLLPEHADMPVCNLSVQDVFFFFTQ